MTQSMEDQYLDVLHNIEAAIVSVFREHSTLTDYEVEKSLNELIVAYRAEGQRRTPAVKDLSASGKLVHARVRVMCEWRLGRQALYNAEEEAFQPEPITLDEIVICLKRIRKSVQTWTRRHGSQGYLQFVNGFIA